MGRSKDADEVFCTACGVRIKRAAVYCPNCGVPNEGYDPSAAPARNHERRVCEDGDDRAGRVDRDRNIGRNVDRDADHVRNVARDGACDDDGDRSARGESTTFDQRTPSEVQATRDAAEARDAEATRHGTAATGTESPTRERDDARSGKWWYGVAAFGAVWALVLGAWAAGIQHGALAGLALLAWAGLPASLARDVGVVRQRSAWQPSGGPWAFGALVPVFNLVVVLVYLIRRHEVLGTP